MAILLSAHQVSKLAVATACILAGLTAVSPARAYPPAVEAACKSDYFRFCSAYPLQSASLRLCMESKASQLSNSCARALISAGYVDRKRFKR